MQKTQSEIDRYMTRIQPARRAEEKYPHAVSAVHPGHRAVHSVRRHLDRAAACRARSVSPISALLVAAGEVRKGNSAIACSAKAIDELATLVRAFNEMMQELEANSRELESRRRFTEAILESIPTGVISLSADGRIQRVNRALQGLFPQEQVERAAHLSDLFSPRRRGRNPVSDEARPPHRRRRQPDRCAYARRRCCTWRLPFPRCPRSRPTAPGFVVVLEDTSELLRAQKAAAWHEVARRIAHELKNPLTPIALSAERIARMLDRGGAPVDAGLAAHPARMRRAPSRAKWNP